MPFTFLFIQYGSVNMKNKTVEEAYLEMLKPAETVTFRVQPRPEVFNQVKDTPGDGFYIRYNTLFTKQSLQVYWHTSPYIATYERGRVCTALNLEMRANHCNLLISLIMFKMEDEILNVVVKIGSPNLHNLPTIIAAVVMRRLETEMHCVCVLIKNNEKFRNSRVCLLKWNSAARSCRWAFCSSVLPWCQPQ